MSILILSRTLKCIEEEFYQHKIFMTSFSQGKILEKLDRLNEYLGYLKTLKKEAKNEKVFLSDFHIFGNTERYLQLSIQIILDVCHLIIIDLGLQKPGDNYGVVSVLFEKELISGALADKLTKMIGLRNILVHEYGRIDRKKIYDILQNQISDIEEFKKQILGFLRKSK